MSAKKWREIEAKVKVIMNDIPNYWDEDNILEDSFSEVVTGNFIYSCRFSVHRNGLSKIASETMPDRSRYDLNENKIEHAFASQTYFCLRDLLHTHRFHAPSSDTILDVYASEEDLKKSVNHSLMRRILAYRRLFDPHAQYRALGIVTYLRAFRVNLMTEKERDDFQFSLEHLEGAIKSEIPLMQARQGRSLRYNADSIGRNAMLFAGALFTYAALIKDSKVLIPDSLSILRGAFVFVQEQFGIALMALALGSLSIGWLSRLKLAPRDKIIRSSSRLSLAFSVRRFALFQFIIGIVLLLISGSAAIGMLYSIMSVPK